MKIKQILLIVLIITTFSTSYGQVNNVSFRTANDSNLYFLKANDFYLTHHLYLDLFLRESLYPDIQIQEAFYVIDQIKKYVAPNQPLTVKIKKSNNKKYNIQFSILDKDGQQILVAMTNHDLKTKKFKKKFSGDSYTRWYFLAHDKLVYRKDMSTEEENQNLQGNDLANAYLFDEKIENDGLINGILKVAIGANSMIKDKLYTKLVDAKLALSTNAFTRADSLLLEAETIAKSGGQELNGFKSAIDVTRIQIKLMKKLAKSDPRHRPPMIDFKEEEPIPFELVERAPIAAGCTADMENKELKDCTRNSIRWHVNRKFNTGIMAAEGQSSGMHKLYARFIIDTNGEIVNVVIEGDSQLLNDEAYRVISSFPTLKPASHKGKAINVKYTLPITLQIN